MQQRSRHLPVGLVVLVLGLTGRLVSAEPSEPPAVRVESGVIQARRPVAEAIGDAMQFLKRADAGYLPGRIDGPLAGYFGGAFVNEDGTSSRRGLSYPARHHAYFIFTFLRYYAYTGEGEWLLRARDLADWNIAHSTPDGDAYAHLPYSTFSDGKPGGHQDGDSLEPDKAAFLSSAYLATYEATTDSKYLDAARKIAGTLVRTQREDGSWPFRVVPRDGTVRQDFGGAPVFVVEFFERLAGHESKPEYRRAQDQALKYMLDTNVEKNLWGTYHEDIREKEKDYLSAEPMSFTADYLFRTGRTRPEYIEMGRRVIRRMEERLVHTEGHAAAPAPAVAEQLGFNHIMPGHTARYCRALADLYAATGDEAAKRRALSGFNATTYMQSPFGLFRTFFHTVNRRAGGKERPNWYSQHLYTVCHVLEAMWCLPEMVPDRQDHLLDGTVFAGEVSYAPGRVRFRTILPSTSVLKLSFQPKVVMVAGQELMPQPADGAAESGWSFDPAKRLLTIRHKAGPVEVLQSR